MMYAQKTNTTQFLAMPIHIEYRVIIAERGALRVLKPLGPDKQVDLVLKDGFHSNLGLGHVLFWAA